MDKGLNNFLLWPLCCEESEISEHNRILYDTKFSECLKNIIPTERYKTVQESSKINSEDLYNCIEQCNMMYISSLIPKLKKFEDINPNDFEDTDYVINLEDFKHTSRAIASLLRMYVRRCINQNKKPVMPFVGHWEDSFTLIWENIDKTQKEIAKLYIYCPNDENEYISFAFGETPSIPNFPQNDGPLRPNIDPILSYIVSLVPN